MTYQIRDAQPADVPGILDIYNDAVRNTTGRMLKSMGYDVLLANDARTAVELARQHSGDIDVLLCDIAMPGRSGPEVARDVLGVSPETRVLFISGYQQGGDASLARHAFLQKPFTRAALGAKLRALGKPSPVLDTDRRRS
jgi:CheY-like chemotaxis protein